MKSSDGHSDRAGKGFDQTKGTREAINLVKPDFCSICVRKNTHGHNNIKLEANISLIRLSLRRVVCMVPKRF